jgi:hypothetical protein
MVSTLIVVVAEGEDFGLHVGALSLASHPVEFGVDVLLEFGIEGAEVHAIAESIFLLSPAGADPLE